MKIKDVRAKLAHAIGAINVADRRIKHYEYTFVHSPDGSKAKGRAGRLLHAWVARKNWLEGKKGYLVNLEHIWEKIQRKRYKIFHAGGWASYRDEYHEQRQDQGQDFEIPLGRHIRAPGRGYVVAHLSDGPWPNGFGSPYAVVRITSGRFAIEDGLWYIGHCNEDVLPVGAHFSFQAKLAKANHGLNAGRGWCELGKATGGYPGPSTNGPKYHYLFRPLKAHYTGR